MTESISNAAHTTLVRLGLAPEGATYNADRNTWEFETTDTEFSAILTALRSPAAREIQAELQAAR